jgi:molybdopterin-guanine dinucleotide biosynthesis protein A
LSQRRPPGVPPATGIVLAGGRSSRFGRDKLAERIGQLSLLEHAIRAVSAVAREIVVVGRPPGETGGIPGVTYVPDPEPFGGPLVGLRTGLEVAGEPLALVVGGDMPSLHPDVLALLLRTLAAGDGWVATRLVHRGRRQPLPMALRVGAATPHARALVGTGERRLQALFTGLATRDLREVEWRALDPTAATLRDVDRPGDLPGSE